MPRSLGYPSLALFTIVLACVVNAVYGAPTAHAAPLVPGPTTIVALGDSAAAGEGGGDYEPGTRGENGDWCHRSPHAYIEHTGLAQEAVNLACSGATSANVGFGTAVHNNEGSQAQRLIGVARTHRVTVVVAQFGANDDPGFAQSVVRCVVAYLQPSGPGCADELAAQWPSRLAAMQPKAVAALNDVRSAMRQAGYADTDYVLVVASYASPVTEAMKPDHGWTGCPYRRSDAQWGRTQAVPQLSEALRAVAGQVNARFLDLSRAAEGHEACSSAGPEWIRHLTVDTRSFAREGFAAVRHLAQESFHPNVIGYAQQAGCLSEFVRGGAASAQCVIGGDGRLHATSAGQLAPAALGR